MATRAEAMFGSYYRHQWEIAIMPEKTWHRQGSACYYRRGENEHCRLRASREAQIDNGARRAFGLKKF